MSGLVDPELLADLRNCNRDQTADLIEQLVEALQQFVTGVETHMIDSPADDILANVTHRAQLALSAARGGSNG